MYNNHVEGNYLAGNGLGGVTLHAHAPGENLNGNTITGNKIYNNVNGVWLGNAGGATITATGSNHFIHVDNPVVTVS